MSQPDIIQLDLPASHKYLNVLGACITAVLARVEGLPNSEATAYNIQLAVHEICTNIVEHAYKGRVGRIGVTLTVWQSPRRVSVELVDTGEAFEPANVAEPDLNHGQVRGYGLFLTRKLMDEVTYQRGIEANRWQLVKDL